MYIDKWVDGYKVHAEKWYTDNLIYINVQYFAPGASLLRPPVWEKTVYITDDEKGRNMVKNNLSTLVNYIAQKLKPCDAGKTVITIL